MKFVYFDLHNSIFGVHFEFPMQEPKNPDNPEKMIFCKLLE